MKEMKTIHIEVTQDDINRGIPKNACRCPIALAVRRTTGVECAVRPCGSYLHQNGSGIDVVSFALPDIASRFIKMFDEYGSVQPFSFDISIPVEH